MNTADYKYQWEGEAGDLLDRVLNAKLGVERIKHPGVYHNYHSKLMAWNQVLRNCRNDFQLV